MDKEIRILILEDFHVDAELAVRELHKANLSVEWHRVETKETFLAALNEFKPELILSDYSLPNFNGIEALRILKNLKLDTPLILVTGSLTEEVAVACMKEGAADYILKSSLKRLPTAVLNVLEKYDANRAKEAAFAALQELNEDLLESNRLLKEEIKERQRAEKSLRESETRFYNAFEHAPIGMALSALDGRFQQVNGSLCEFVGYTKEELKAIDFRAITHPDDLAETLTNVNQLLNSEIKSFQIEKRYRHKLGHTVWGLTSVSIDRDEQNNPLNFIAQVQDITERKLAEEGLRESQQMLQLVMDTIPQGVFWKDLNSVYLGGNRVLTEMLGLKNQKEIIGKSDGELSLRKEEVDFFHEYDRRVMETGVAEYHVINSRLQNDGSEKWYSTSKVPLRDVQGNIIGILGTVEDITERRRTEAERRSLEEQLRQSQKLEAVGQLAGGIAHDFNNLLTVINGFSEMTLRKLEPDSSLCSYIEEIKKAGERAAALTRQLLAFSRKQVLRPRVLNLNNIVENINKMLRRLIDENTDICTSLDPELGHVKADEGQMEQVLMNLAVNAHHAMPEGGKLTIQTSNVYFTETDAERPSSVPPGSYVILNISDTGCGMDAETKLHIFEPFFTTKEQGKGTGLGLSTVYGIVKQFGGYISVDSEVGRGTAFRIYLPRVSEEVDLRPPVKSNGRPFRASGTILLVEDEQGVRRVLTEVLESRGYKVLTAFTGQEALNYCRDHPDEIQLILTDMVMPEMNGIELTEHVRRLLPEIKVILMSGYTDKSVARQAILDSEMVFLEKPFSPDALIERVQAVLTG